MDSACWISYFLIALTAISQTKAITWFEAQSKCREKNQSLTLWRNKSTSFYWTGFYRKRSHWIKIIATLVIGLRTLLLAGCYNSSVIQTTRNEEIKLLKPSPPLCQEHCLQKKFTLYAVQNNTCICLPDGFDSSRNQLASSNCTYRCASGLLLSTECGGKSAFNVFLTDTTNLNVSSRCLSLQCGAGSTFMNNACKTFLVPVCSSLATSTTFTSWMETKKHCKVNGNYPIGNLTLSNIKMACTESNYNNTSPGWIGVVHEVNKTEDQGQLISKSDQVFVKRCLKCLLNESTQKRQCEYDVCDVHLTNTIYCSKDELTTPQQENTDMSYLETTTTFFSTSLYETTSVVSIDSDKIESKEERNKCKERTQSKEEAPTPMDIKITQM